MLAASHSSKRWAKITICQIRMGKVCQGWPDHPHKNKSCRDWYHSHEAQSVEQTLQKLQLRKIMVQEEAHILSVALFYFGSPKSNVKADFYPTELRLKYDLCVAMPTRPSSRCALFRSNPLMVILRHMHSLLCKQALFSTSLDPSVRML